MNSGSLVLPLYPRFCDHRCKGRSFYPKREGVGCSTNGILCRSTFCVYYGSMGVLTTRAVVVAAGLVLAICCEFMRHLPLEHLPAVAFGFLIVQCSAAFCSYAAYITLFPSICPCSVGE